MDVDFGLVRSDAITQIAIGSDARVLKKFFEPAANCALCASDLKNLAPHCTSTSCMERRMAH